MLCSQKTRPGCGSATGGAGWPMTVLAVISARHESKTSGQNMAD
jgi:hypothetical protein